MIEINSNMITCIENVRIMPLNTNSHVIICMYCLLSQQAPLVIKNVVEFEEMPKVGFHGDEGQRRVGKRYSGRKTFVQDICHRKAFPRRLVEESCPSEQTKLRRAYLLPKYASILKL